MANSTTIRDEDLRGLERKELIELLEMTEPLGSRFDTKFHLYMPTPIAIQFHASPAKIRAHFGGNRSSKSYSHVEDTAMQFTGEVPKSLEGLIPEYRLDTSRRIRFCMQDYPNSFEKVVWPLFKLLVPSDSIETVKRDQGRIKAIINKQGGFVEFMQYDQDVSKFPGASRHQISYDEEPPQDIRDENLMRIVDTDGDEVFSLTPVSGALKYLYDDVFMKRSVEYERAYEFVLDEVGNLIDAIPGEVQVRTIPGGDPDIHAFFSCIFDNPAITTQAALRILSKFPKEEMIVRGKGHFLFLSGLVYKEYNDTTHLVEPFTDWYKGLTKSDYTLYVAIDPHPRTPHAVLFMVVHKSGQKYIVDEIFDGCTGDELVEQIHDKCNGKTPASIIIDPLAYTPDPFTKSNLVYDLVEAGLNNPCPQPASKNKSHGLIVTRKALIPRKVNSGKMVPEVLFCTNCVVTRKEISHYAWDDYKKDTQNTKGEKQEPIKKNDHMMENLRRLVLHNLEFEEEHDKDFYNRATEKVGRNKTTGY